MLCAKFGWNWPSGSWEEDENVKSLLTDGNTDRWQTDWRQVIRKAHLSFQLGKLKTEGFIDVNITFFVCLGFLVTRESHEDQWSIANLTYTQRPEGSKGHLGITLGVWSLITNQALVTFYDKPMGYWGPILTLIKLLIMTVRKDNTEISSRKACFI